MGDPRILDRWTAGEPLSARKLNQPLDVLQSLTHAPTETPGGNVLIRWVRMKEWIGPADDFHDRKAALQLWDEATNKWKDASPEQELLIDDLTEKMYYPKDAILPVFSSRSGKLVPLGGHATALLCKATSDLSAGPVSGNFEIWSGTMASGEDSGITTLPEIELQADVKSGDFFIAKWVNNGWVVSVGGANTNRRFLGTLGAALASASSTATVALTTALDGGELPEGVTSAANTLNKSGQNGATVVVEEDLSTETTTYHLMDVERVVVRYVTQVRYDSSSHKYQMKRQRATVLYEEAEGDWEDIVELTPVEVLDNVYWSSPFLQRSPITIYLPEAPEEGADSTILNAVPSQVVESVEDAGTSLLQHVKTPLVFEDADASPDPVATIDGCET
jgi:hypothetical protein